VARRRAIDPRLVRASRTTRRFLVASIALGSVTALLLVSQAWLLASAISRAFRSGSDLSRLRWTVALLGCVLLTRAVVVWVGEVVANRASAGVKSELRTALLDHIGHEGHESPDGGTGALVALVTHGVDAMDRYFSAYLPQLFLAAIVPIMVLVFVVTQDWLSALIIALTLPLVPVFMALIGLATRDRIDRQFRILQRLSGHFLDVVSGLGVLKVFGRSKLQVKAIGEVTDRYRRNTLDVLKMTFLSSLVLELLATLSVALVAVAVGLRLMGGKLDLRTGLFVLLLAPEAFLPLRNLGANYHASEEGMAAGERVFEILDEPLTQTGGTTVIPDPSRVAIEIDEVQFTYPGHEVPALRAVSLVLPPGEITALTGPSGCGKSTLLALLLRFLIPDEGSVSIGSLEIGHVDAGAWREKIAWLPQRPHIFAGSVDSNIRLGRPHATPEEVNSAIADAGLVDVVAGMPRGLETEVGEGGWGLSAGERQRIALARVFLRDAPLLLLDEPAATLDGSTERIIAESIYKLASGRTVVLVTHRPALLDVAHQVVRLGDDFAEDRR